MSQPDKLVNINFIVGGKDHELQLVILYPFRNSDGSRPMHVDFHDTVTGEKGRYENMTLPPAQNRVSKMPAFVAQLVSRKSQRAPAPSPRFP